jgi:uncharacterized protein DUF6085
VTQNADTVGRLLALLEERDHIIQFSDNGWIIAHPLQERLEGTLFDCQMQWDGPDPGVRGRYWLEDDGRLGGPYPSLTGRSEP